MLDKATSSLDVITERIVEQRLSQLTCTQIIIAHRLSTIRHADLILVVDQGTIVERGTHEELLKLQGFYAKLIESQLANGEIKNDCSASPICVSVVNLIRLFSNTIQLLVGKEYPCEVPHAPTLFIHE